MSKEAICITQNGLIISNDNIDGMLNSRHINQKMRREKKIYSKIKKRNPLANVQFEKSLRTLIENNLNL